MLALCCLCDRRCSDLRLSEIKKLLDKRKRIKKFWLIAGVIQRYRLLYDHSYPTWPYVCTQGHLSREISPRMRSNMWPWKTLQIVAHPWHVAEKEEMGLHTKYSPRSRNFSAYKWYHRMLYYYYNNYYYLYTAQCLGLRLGVVQLLAGWSLPQPALSILPRPQRTVQCTLVCSASCRAVICQLLDALSKVNHCLLSHL